jgi:hypothetical protein
LRFFLRNHWNFSISNHHRLVFPIIINKIIKMKKLAQIILMFTISLTSFSQVGIGTTEPKGALDVHSNATNTLAMIVPRVPDYSLVTSSDGTAPINGSMVYDTTLEQLMFYIEGSWITLGKNTTGDGVEVGVIVPPFAGEQVSVDIDGEAAGDQSGRSVSLSADGTVVAIGANNNSGNGSSSGHVRVYQTDGTTWTQVGADIDGEAANDQSGWSVSLSSDGTVVAIGATSNSGNGSSSGHVRVYQTDGTTWTQVGADIDGEAADDYSGWSVSLSADGTVVAIGAPYNDGNGDTSGHVRVYQTDGTTWIQVGADIDGEAADNQSGDSVSLSADGTVVAIGAHNNDENGNNSGHVRVYQTDGTTWTQIGADIDGEAEWDRSGCSVSLSSDGTVVAIGARTNSGNGPYSGHVRVYAINGTTWTQVGADIDGEAADDYSGWSVSLSADGTVVAIGAYGNDGNGTGSGHIRVYETDGTTWTQVGPDIDGEAVNDQSGFSVSLSADGTVVAIGAYRNDGNGTDSGHVRVFK